jgi:hypothetical protein
MAIPIIPISHKENKAPSAQSFSSFFNSSLDYLSNSIDNKEQNGNRKVEASNKDADSLLKIWINGTKTQNGTFDVKAVKEITSSEIDSLKRNGFITVANEKISFTNRAKLVITTMCLGENNNFLKNKKNVSYKEILASMDKSNKQGYRIPKFASSIDISDKEDKSS